MKYLYALISIFFSYTMYSQSYEYIKKLDTLYIPFREGKFDSKVNYPPEKNGFKNREYTFKDKKNNNKFYFELDRNKISENMKVNKSFLRKNKRNIIKINDLKKFNYQDVACDLFNRLKIIYIVDFSEKKDKGIMLYRVMSLNLCYVKE